MTGREISGHPQTIRVIAPNIELFVEGVYGKRTVVKTVDVLIYANSKGAVHICPRLFVTASQLSCGLSAA